MTEPENKTLHIPQSRSTDGLDGAKGMRFVGTVMASVLGVCVGGSHGWEIGVSAAYLMFLLIDIRYELERRTDKTPNVK